MKFSFSSEQEEFRSNLRRFLANRSPTTEVRRLMETDDGYERDGWRSTECRQRGSKSILKVPTFDRAPQSTGVGFVRQAAQPHDQQVPQNDVDAMIPTFPEG
jgi:hypothetical protein